MVLLVALLVMTGCSMGNENLDSELTLVGTWRDNPRRHGNDLDWMWEVTFIDSSKFSCILNEEFGWGTAAGTGTYVYTPDEEQLDPSAFETGSIIFTIKFVWDFDGSVNNVTWTSKTTLRLNELGLENIDSDQTLFEGGILYRK